MKNLGVEYPSQNKEVMDKMKKTNIERYGCEYSAQNVEVAEKSSKNLLV
jgi:hypothetical protein